MQKTNTTHFFVAMWNHKNKVNLNNGAKKNLKNATFQTNWFLKYGLQVSTRHPTTKEITSVVCFICNRFGCEGKEE